MSPKSGKTTPQTEAMTLNDKILLKKKGQSLIDITFRTFCSIAPKSVLFCCIMDNLVKKKGMREREEFPIPFFEF